MAEASTKEQKARADRHHKRLIIWLGVLFVVYPIVIAHAIFAVWPSVELASAVGEDLADASATRTVTLFWQALALTPGQAYYLLMAVFGMAGAYVATATSFATYVGMRRFKASWGWWYALRPFIGAGVAVILMIAILGGLVAVTSDSSAVNPVNLNPYAVAAFSALAGWFSKTTSEKLEEIFETILSTSKDADLGDKLDSTKTTEWKPGDAIEIVRPSNPTEVLVDTELAIEVKSVTGLQHHPPTDAEGSEVAEAIVAASGNGRYAFSASAPGEYRARFTAPDHEAAVLSISVTEGNPPAAINVIAVGDTENPAEAEPIEAAVAESVVVDIEPIEGLAAVGAKDAEGNALKDVKVEPSPGEDGQFLVTPTSPGKVLLEFAAADAEPVVLALDVKPKGRFAGVYLVRPGDTLGGIARRFETTVDEIVAENPQITDPDRITVGDRVNVPLIGEPGTLQPIVVPDVDDDDDTPVWMAVAERELETGVREIKGQRHNPRIVEYHRATTLSGRGAGGRDETPWCSSFVNFCMAQAGVKGTRSARARSWLKWKNGEELEVPRRGCVVVFSRPPKKSQGHVAFFAEEDGDRIIVLGGNQGDQVSLKAYPKSRLLGYRWPKEPGPLPISAELDAEPDKDWTQVDMADRCRYVMNLLTEEYGYPQNAAAGIVGNLMVESGLIPNRIEGSKAATPMTAKGTDDVTREWTAAEVAARIPKVRGPKRPGVGLAQWTTKQRRAGLFEHEYRGERLGHRILFDMDAQVDYLVDELGSRFGPLDRQLRDADITLETAAAEVVYRYEVPGSVLGKASGKTVKLGREDPKVVKVFNQRARRAAEALRSVSA